MNSQEDEEKKILTRKESFVAFSEYLNFMTLKHRAIVEEYNG
jgi:hypothetical protein